MEEDSDFSFKKITIIGLGLIGGSMGLALRRKKVKFQIAGVDKQEIIEKALIRGAIDIGTVHLDEGVKEADMVILATPVKEITALFPMLNTLLPKGCLVTDTGSTKTEIIREAELVLSDDYSFIGGHPLAGLEKGGIENACPDLFLGKPYLVVSKNRDSRLANEKISAFIDLIGAIKIKIDADEHDQVVALVSHLPQLIAVIMANMFGKLIQEKKDEQFFRISGNAFNEMTRIAQSPFTIWKDIYQTNRDWTIAFIEELENDLERVKKIIKVNPAALEKDFKEASLIKEKMLQIV